MDKKAIRFEEYNPDLANWDSYIDRLKFCFEANGVIVDNVKRANFFTVCGSRVYDTLLALITPRKATDVTFTEIETILSRHYSPTPNEITMSFKFYKREQKRCESASDFIADVRKLSSKCNFTDLERMLRDKLVCGMSDSRLQYELLKRDNLQYQDVVNAMLASESAVRDVRMIHGTTSITGAVADVRTRAETSEVDAGEPMDVNAVQTTVSNRLCYRCGNRHAGECRFVNAICRFCKKRGHIEKICIKKKKSNQKDVNFTQIEDNGDLLNGIYNMQSATRVPPYEVDIFIAGVPVRMQVDTGASFSLINERTWSVLCSLLPQNTLKQVQLSLRTWNETPVKLLGQAILPVRYRNVLIDLTMIVAKGNGPNLLGRNWLAPLNISMNINFIASDDLAQLEKVITRHTDVFRDGLGTYNGNPVTIHVKSGANPRFLKARPVPYALRERVENEIDRLEQEGVLCPVSFSEWATPVVPIVKKSGEIRLCGDYRSTVNEATESDTYPMPTANEVFATVAGGKIFTTLDLDRAYTQVVVDDNTSKLLTLNTCKGLYTVHRLAFGVKACPGIFQRLMTSLLAGIPGVAVLIDDIIISGRSMLEMLERLDMVLGKIEKAGLRLNKMKCKFAQEKVEFLGFVIDAEGIHPAPSKVDSIVKTPAPKNKKELQAFLGLYNFYERFVPHKATILEPLHRLLDAKNIWKWSKVEQNAFETAKRLLTFDVTLVHYDVNKPLILTCDSSEYGVGAVLSHEMEDMEERPIAMASRTLHSHERRYSQLDKEAASIMFGITKFHNYLMARRFRIVTDHKPLLGIFDPKKPMPTMLSPRLTRIVIALSAHNYDIVYKPGSQIGYADSLSRWPQPVAEQPEQLLSDILLMAEAPDDFPYDAERVALATKQDKTLCQVVHYIKHGWPTKMNDKCLRPFWLHKLELSLQDDCILLGCRVFIPSELRPHVLQVLHKAHSGIVQTKSVARSYVWWPGLNEDIELMIGSCPKCLENRHMPPKVVHEWITPTRPWSRIHIDWAGPYKNKYFLIMVDAYSRWPEVFVVNNTTSATAIGLLRSVFATHGLCEVLVSDNGTSFISSDMQNFLKANNIRHVKTAPYHPATNGLAERMVQTIKGKLSKMDNLPWAVRIPNLLLALRSTPCITTNKSPSELLMKRRLRTLLDTLHPDNLRNTKNEQEIYNNNHKKPRQTNVNQKVMYRNYNQSGPRWLPGIINEKSGPSNYKVKTSEGTIINRHIDQLIKMTPAATQTEGEVNGNREHLSPNITTENIDVDMDKDEDDMNESKEKENSQEEEEIITIPDATEWAEMLGIPSSSDSTGKIKNKFSVRAKSPYQRPQVVEDAHYLN